MNEQQLREIAEAAFKRQFGDIEVVGVNIRQGLGFEDDSPVVHVDIIHDDEDGQVARCGYLGVLSEILDKTWYEGEGNLGYPLVHLLVKSGQPGQATASQCGLAPAVGMCAMTPVDAHIGANRWQAAPCGCAGERRSASGFRPG